MFALCAPRLATAAATGDSEAEIREAAAVANLLAEIASAPLCQELQFSLGLSVAVPELVDPLPAVARSMRLKTSISGVAMGFAMLVLKHSAQELAEQGERMTGGLMASVYHLFTLAPHIRSANASAASEVPNTDHPE